MGKMVTKCPECESEFNVTEELLSVAKGKVRCGVCEYVFRASDYWVTPPGAAPSGGGFQFDQSAIDDSSAEGLLTKLDMPVVNTMGQVRAVSATDIQKSIDIDEDAISDTNLNDAVDIKEEDDTDEDYSEKFKTNIITSINDDGTFEDKPADESWVDQLLDDDD